MTRWRRYMPVRSIRRVSRFSVAMSVLPAVMLSPLTAPALVIHDHHGHDTHGHAVTLCDLDHHSENPDHRHEKHDHDGLPVEDEGSSILIVLDIPEALPGARAYASGTVVASGIGVALRTLVTNRCMVDVDPFPVGSRRTLGDILRADGLVTGILLTNHALLL